MKKILTSMLLAALSIPAFSQITLDQTNYPPPTDTVALLNVYSQLTTPPAVGTSQTWDYSSLTLATGTPASNIFALVSGDPNFPAAQFISRNALKGLTAAVGYFFDTYYVIDATGAKAIGIHVPAKNYGLGAYTGNNNDTLYVLDNILYYPTTPRPIVAFPATTASAWQSSLRHVVNMQLTVAAASLNKAPMQQVFYYDRSDSVVGWGTLKLPVASGFNSNIPVLQDMVSQYCVDSIYVGGSPAPPSLTGAFGITQGQISGPKFDRILFYRAGSFNYQMMFNFTDNTFTTTGSVYVNTALPVATGINDINTDNAASAVYPNPVNGSNFSILLTGNAKPSGVHIQDMTGRIMDASSVTIDGDKLHVRMNNPLSAGLYIYTVVNADGKSIASGKITTAQ